MKGEKMLRRRNGVLLGSLGILAASSALAIVLATGGSQARQLGKFAAGDPTASRTDTPGEGPVGGYDAYLSAARTYPANEIPPSVVQNARATFEKIAKSGDPSNGNNHWHRYGPQQNAIQPGVLSFSGATTPTASRTTALVIAPTCNPGNCRVWAGVS